MSIVDKLAGLWAFVDVGVVLAVPVVVVILAVKQKPLWKSYALALLPYLAYSLFAGRMPYLTTYVLIFACLAPTTLLHQWNCEGWWRMWGTAVIVLGVVPTALLFLAHQVRKRLRTPAQGQ